MISLKFEVLGGGEEVDILSVMTHDVHLAGKQS